MPRKPKGTGSRGPGRPQYVPTPEEQKKVRDMAATGTGQHQIALLMGMSINTLRKYFMVDIRKGEAMASVTVGGALFKMASDPKHKKCFEAARYYLERKGGWGPPEKAAGGGKQGKKEEQAEAARKAGQDSGWGDLLMTPPIQKTH